VIKDVGMNCSRSAAVVTTALVLLSGGWLQPPAALSQPASSKPATDGWSPSGYDAAQTAYNPKDRQLTPTAAKHLTKKWSHPLPGGAVVQGKAVYASVQGGVRAYSAATGHAGRLYRIAGASHYTVPSPAVATANISSCRTRVCSSP
jgi:hypothetical protein